VHSHQQDEQHVTALVLSKCAARLLIFKVAACWGPEWLLCANDLYSSFPPSALLPPRFGTVREFQAHVVNATNTFGGTTYNFPDAIADGVAVSARGHYILPSCVGSAISTEHDNHTSKSHTINSCSDRKGSVHDLQVRSSAPITVFSGSWCCFSIQTRGPLALSKIGKEAHNG